MRHREGKPVHKVSQWCTSGPAGLLRPCNSVNSVLNPPQNEPHVTHISGESQIASLSLKVSVVVVVDKALVFSYQMSCPFLLSCLRHLSSLRLQSPVVKLAVATGYVAEGSTIARLCPSRGSGDRPHRPLSGSPPVSPCRHTIFLKSQCLIESDDGLSKNSETPKKGLQLLYKGVQGDCLF